MRVKLYKGPQHGKVYEVPNHLREILVFTSNRASEAYFRSDPLGMTAPAVDTVVYRPAYMKDPQGNIAMAMHPDGSVFFVYERKR